MTCEIQDLTKKKLYIQAVKNFELDLIDFEKMLVKIENNYNEYLSASSSSMIAAWLPQR